MRYECISLRSGVIVRVYQLVEPMLDVFPAEMTSSDGACKTDITTAIDNEREEPMTPIKSEDGKSVCLVPSKYLKPFEPKIIDGIARSAEVFYKPDLEGTGENYLLVIQYPDDKEPTIVPVPRGETIGFITPFSKKPE